MDVDEDEWEDEEDITDEDDEESRYALPPESHSSDSESDQSSEEDQPPPSPRRGRGRQPMMCTPGLDNDPSEPCPQDAPFTRDRHGWSRKLNKVKVHRFRGPKPRGPTFERPLEDQPLLYFLMFFPLLLFKKIAKWTNKAGGKHPGFSRKTTAAEVRVLYPDHPRGAQQLKGLG